LIFLINKKSINSWKIFIVMRIQMTNKKTIDECCNSDESPGGCDQGSGCKVEAILSVDERGQMVLPKDVREKAGINTGNKLALISWEKDGSICCLALIKVEALSGMVKEVLDPLMKDTD
jgi:antitoxin PrlF